MCFQRFDGAEALGQFALAQAGVDFLVADVVQQNRLAPFAAAQAGDEVMQALRDMGRDRPVAERADRIVVQGCRSRCNASAS